MIKTLSIYLILACILLSGCESNNKKLIYQTSTIDALLAGVFDGEMTLKQLSSHGNFGIGTFNNLDGEMIVLDGNIYQIKDDGKVYRPTLSIKTPFATVCNFYGGDFFSLPIDTNFETFENIIDSKIKTKNLFYAIKITGTFKNVKTRSVPRQKKPYPPLQEVTKNQPEFQMNNIDGTILGFRCPPFVKGINVPDYHLHFISKDKSKGGHLLTFETETASAEIVSYDEYFLKLPSNSEKFALEDLSKDRKKELEEVEK